MKLYKFKKKILVSGMVMSEGTVMIQAYQLPLNAFQLFGVRKSSTHLRHTHVWD
jgi:hypothetical protein